MNLIPSTISIASNASTVSNANSNASNAYASNASTVPASNASNGSTASTAIKPEVDPCPSYQCVSFKPFTLSLLLTGSDNWDLWNQEVLLTYDLHGHKDSFKHYSPFASSLRSILFLGISPSLRTFFLSYDTLPKLWIALNDRYGNPPFFVVYDISTEFTGVPLQPGQSVSAYLQRKRQLVEKLRLCGSPITDFDVVCYLLAGTRAQFPTIAAFYTHLRKDQLVTQLPTLSEFETILITAEAARAPAIGIHPIKAAVAKLPFPSPSCQTCGRGNHSTTDCWRDILCSKCNRKGHPDAKCRWAPKQSLSSYFKSPNTLIDSGATHNMIAHKSQFTTYGSTDHQDVKFANGQHAPTIGEGTITLPTSNLTVPAIHVPSIIQPLLSVFQLTNQTNGTFHFTSDKCWLTDSHGIIITTGSYINGDYLLDPSHTLTTPTPIPIPQCNRAQLAPINQLESLHHRFGHRNIDDILWLSNNDLISNIDLDGQFLPFDCSICATSKAKRLSFPRQAQEQSREILDKISSDLCGPLPVTSVNGSKYFVTYTDSYSRYRWTYLLTTKAEQCQIFIQLCNQLQRLTDRKIKILLSDNGGEYLSNRLQTYLADQGIQHQTTVPHCSAQNGIAERANGVLMDMARAMLAHAGLPPTFWGAAILYATDITNCMPHPKDRTTTPYMLFFNKKPNAKQFKVFGCDAYHPRANKLSSSSDRLTYIGNPRCQKGWTLWNWTKQRVETHYHVRFHQQSFTHHLSGTEIEPIPENLFQEDEFTDELPMIHMIHHDLFVLSVCVNIQRFIFINFCTSYCPLFPVDRWIDFR